MNKIIKIALKNAFKEVDLESLMEVIVATGNPTVATEVLLGIYEEPVIVSTTVDSDTVKTFTSFNKYSNRVEYSFVRNEKKRVYFKTQEEMDSVDKYHHSLKRYLGTEEESEYPFSKVFEIVEEGNSYTDLKYWK